MKSIGAVVVIVIVLLAGAYLYRPVYITPGEVEAQDAQVIDVEVTFRPTGSEVEQGDACGYESIFDGGTWPHSRQVVVTDAAGVVVGTVDLLDIFDLSVSEAAKPGIVDGSGYCVVEGTVSAAPSTYYTFEIEGAYRWTVSSQELQGRDWTMPIIFLESDV
jgi:hypothetical protein